MPAKTDKLPPLREVIAAHGLAAKKSLGQNFLFDLNLTAQDRARRGRRRRRDVLRSRSRTRRLTRALLAEGADKVIAVERDERCLPALAEIAAA